MKHAFESEETFTAYATIDAGYYMIGQIKKEFDMPKSPIISAIDKATGFDKKFTNDKAKELNKENNHNQQEISIEINKNETTERTF